MALSIVESQREVNLLTGHPLKHGSRIVGKIKFQITYFAHGISDGFKRPLRRFLAQAVFKKSLTKSQ